MPKRFCCKWSIMTGVEVIGYLQIFEIVFILTLYTVLAKYSYIALIVLPTFVFLMFIRMMKKDGIKPRRQFFCAWFLSELTMSIVMGM